MIASDNKPEQELLNDGWTLRNTEHGIDTNVSVPFDVHSALLSEQIIADPYWRSREFELDWIHETEWILERDIVIDDDVLNAHWTLSFDSVDCYASVRINGELAGRVDSQFIRHDLDISELLQVGNNHVHITLHSNSRIAADAAKQSPFELPYVHWNCRIGHLNYLRKTQCHAGWDWNIALMPLGVYGDVRLIRSDIARLDEIKIVQFHSPRHARVEITAYAEGFDVGETDWRASLAGQTQHDNVIILPGENQIVITFDIENPELWWPNSEGGQSLHDLHVSLAGRTLSKRIGLRQVELLTPPDEIGSRFVIAVNGREIFMRGANWIPADALPQRCTPETVEALLRSATDANMNMLRIWGGGQYEPDWFYQQCDEAGILIWQDFMFACAHYPATNPVWLDLVRREARQQVRRLSSHASVALWCGDNELIGALGWWPITQANRDRYLANYVILNHALEEIVAAEAIDVPYWPSSPSPGPMNYGDAWHDDRSGDMHFWDVWHSAKEFKHYRTVQPRFCSEFGFQSFPSMPLIERFTEPSDRNVSSPVMDTHQRNVGGNSRIVETISRYFRFPDSFSDMVFLSQVSQGLAMQTAIEYWRSCKPRCMGTLYWQLNDTWPVASWASLEHGGAWKVCHYLTRRFYKPELVTAQPDTATGETVIWAIADCANGVDLTISLMAVRLDGTRTSLVETSVTVSDDRAIEVTRLSSGEIPEEAILLMNWHDADGKHDGENTYFPNRHKAYDLPVAIVESAWIEGPTGPSLELQTNAPAFFVTVDLGCTTVWSDGAFTLLPGQPKRIQPLFDSGDGKRIEIDTTRTPPIQHLTGTTFAKPSGSGKSP